MKNIPNRLIILPVLLMSAFGSKATVQAQQYENLLASPELGFWMKPNGETAGEGWKLEPGGILHLDGRGGNIVSREDMGDFELWFEFQISEKGNSGIKYRVKQFDGPWLGCEYQIQDDGAFPNMARKHVSASLYDVYVPRDPKGLQSHGGAGVWHVGKIEVRNNHVRHWLNGKLMIDRHFGSEDWKDARGKSKFRNREGFGENVLGRLMLTDHGTEVWYRNMFLRRYPQASAAICPTCRP